MTQLSVDFVSKFESFVESFINENIDEDEFIKIDEIKNVLKQSNAIIAGGSVLRFCSNEQNELWETGDIDIYVNNKNVIPIRNFLASFSQRVEILGYGNNIYNKNFFNVSKIYKVVRFYTKFDYIQENVKHIDLVYVHNSMKLNKVVETFDLTCCQVWYDGTSIYAKYPEMIMERKSQINPLYIHQLLKGNKSTHNRIRKYINRGFEIIYPREDIAIETFNQIYKNYNEVSYRKILSNVIFLYIFDVNGRYRDFNSFYGDRKFYLEYDSSTPYLIKNTLRCKFYEDGFDMEEFNSYEDYNKIGKGWDFITTINTLYKFLHTYFRNENLKELYIDTLKSMYGDYIEA